METSTLTDDSEYPEYPNATTNGDQLTAYDECTAIQDKSDEFFKYYLIVSVRIPLSVQAKMSFLSRLSRLWRREAGGVEG